jgi:signal transduction histidine kinase
MRGFCAALILSCILKKDIKAGTKNPSYENIMELSSVNIRRWFLVIFALSCLGMNVLAYVLYIKNQEVVRSKDWVAHTYEVMSTDYALYSYLSNTETAQRGFLLTLKPVFTEAFDKNLSDAKSTLNTLRELTKDNADRQKQLTDLEELMNAREERLRKQISVYSKGGQISVEELLGNREVMTKIRNLVDTMISDEKKLLKQRSTEERVHQENYVSTIFLSAGFAILGLLIANGVILFLTLRRQAAEADLIRATKEMEGFTYIASHDLRSPLVNLKGFASEMKYGIDELKPILDRAKVSLNEQDRKTVDRIMDEDITDALHYIHTSVEKMDKLTNAILELSRIGRRSLNIEPVDVTAIVRKTLDALHHQIASRNIETIVHPLPPVLGDQMSLEHTFGNIIDNAIKYADPSRQGRIEIGGNRNYKETTYWIKDNGRGINEADQEKIFEIYRRGGNNEDIPGEGMGMAYVRATLRRMSGSIRCESKQGVGTTFFITISNTLKKENKQ